MIYKGLIPLTFFAAIVSSNVHARCVGAVVNGVCHGTEVQGLSDDREERYESNTGTSYQYNLSNPADRNRYSIDLDAQRRDQMNLNPRKEMDRQSGQYGGGIYND